MFWLWVGLFIIFVAVCIVLVSSIRGEVHFTRVRDNDQLSFHVRALFGLFHYRFVVPVIKFKNWSKGVMVKSEAVNQKSSTLIGEQQEHFNKEKIVDLYTRVKLLLENAVNINSWLKQTLRHVSCSKLSWVTRLGIGDAPETAISTGMVWAIKSSMLGFVMKYVQVRTRPQIAVIPQYNQHQFATEFHAEGQIRVAYVLWAGVMLLVRIYKVKGGLRVWYEQIIRSGHFRSRLKMSPQKGTS